MATKLPTRGRTPPGAPAGGRPGAPEVELLEIDQVGNLLDELQDDQAAEVCVWRAAGQNSPREKYLFSVPAVSMTLPQLMDKLRDDYGGGDFRIRGRKGSQYHGGSRTISVEQPAAGRVPAAPAAAMGPGFGTNEMLTLLMQQNQAMMANLVTLATKAPAAAPSLGFGDVLSAAKIMMGQPAAAPSSPLGQLKELLEIQDLLKPKGGGGEIDGDTDWLGLLKGFAPVLQQALAQAPTAAPAPVAMAPGPTAPIATPAETAASAPAAVVAAAPPHPLLRLVARLIKAAKLDSDPEAYAVFVLDEVGEEAARQLLADDGAVQRLSSMLPPELVSQVAEHLEWFQELQAAVRDQLDADPEEGGQGVTNGADAVQRAGHASNPAKHVVAPAAAQPGAAG